MDRENVSGLIAEQLSQITDETARRFIEAHLIEPRPKQLFWEYGNGEPHTAWLFADMGERNVFAVYCDGGFGALGAPWGIIIENKSHFGQDSGWYGTLEGLVSEWVDGL